MDFWERSADVQYDLFDMSLERRVTLCGTNFYPNPTLHVDRVMDEHDIMYIYDGQWQVNQDGVNYRMVSGDVLEYWKMPVSCAIPMYSASAQTRLIFPGSRKRKSTPPQRTRARSSSFTWL